MKVTVKIYINQTVRVTLTNEGLRIFNRWLTQYPDLEQETLAKSFFLPLSHTIEVPLWRLMQIFGSHCFLESIQLFENNSISITSDSD